MIDQRRLNSWQITHNVLKVIMAVIVTVDISKASESLWKWLVDPQEKMTESR